MLTIGGPGLRAPTECAHTRPLQPSRLRCRSWFRSGSIFSGLVLATVSSAASRKSVIERERESEVDGASARGDGLSDGEFWGTSKAGFVGVIDVGVCGLNDRGPRGQ